MLKITNLVKGSVLTASSVVLGLGIVGTPSAIASNEKFWDVEFFDQSGAVVGNGEFSYDPHTTTFIATDVDFLPSLPPDGFYVNTALETANFNIFGLEVGNFGASETWWFETDRDLGQQFVDRSGQPNIRYNSWVFSDDEFRFAEDVLNMTDMELSSETLAMGDWDFFGYDSTVGEIIDGMGHWTATKRSHQVPEPTTTLSLLAFSAIGAVSAFKRKN